MDERDHQDQKPYDHLRDLHSLQGVMTPPQSLDESPSMAANKRRTRPFSMLSYTNPTISQPSVSPSPGYPEAHSRNASFSSAHRSLAHPVHGTPPKRVTTRWTVIIIPPALLPHSPPPPHVSGFAHGYGASGRYSAGLLLPLHPTLTLQLASIAREFSLPSTGGLSLHLTISSVDQPTIPGPRVTDESWNVLFGWAFEDNPPAYAGLQAATGLPIAGRLEFDIDMKKARWFDAWAAASQPSNRLSSQIQHSVKLTSTNFTPVARGPEQIVPSSSVSGVRTLITSTRRHSSKSSATDESLRDNARQLPIALSENVEGAPRSPASIKSSQASPTRYLSGMQDTRAPSSPATISSAEAYHRQQLERLVESEELSATQEDSWHIQQETMLRQATLEREQIELADRLADERKVREERKLSLQSDERPINSFGLTTHKPTSPTFRLEQVKYQKSIDFRQLVEQQKASAAELSRSKSTQEVDPSEMTPVRNHMPDVPTENTKPPHTQDPVGSPVLNIRAPVGTQNIKASGSTENEIPIMRNIPSDHMDAITTPKSSHFQAATTKGHSDGHLESVSTSDLPTSETTMIRDNSSGHIEVTTASESTQAEPFTARILLTDSKKTVATPDLAEAQTSPVKANSGGPMQNTSSQFNEIRNLMARTTSPAPPHIKKPDRTSAGGASRGAVSPSTPEFASHSQSQRKFPSSPTQDRTGAGDASRGAFSPSAPESASPSQFQRKFTPSPLNLKAAPKIESRSNHLSEPAREHKSVETGGSCFSPGLGRPVNRFSGEQELMKRRMKTAQGDQQTQQILTEMDRLVNEKAMAKEAMIRSNPSIKTVRDEEPLAPALVKTTNFKVPPPPLTRSKVIQLAKSFGSADPDHSPSNSAHSSPKTTTRALDSPIIPTVPLPPSKSEPDSESLAHPPVIQGSSSSNSTQPLDGPHSIGSLTDSKTITRALDSPIIPPAPLPPVKTEPVSESLAHPPVVQGFSSSNSTQPLEGQRPIDSRTEPLPAIPFQSTPSSATPLLPSKPEPDFAFLAHPPVVQGSSSSYSTPPLDGQRSTGSRIEPLPVNPAYKSAPPSVTSSPSTSSLSLFKPRLSIGNNLFSSIFRGPTLNAPIQPDPVPVDPLAPILNCYNNPARMSNDLSSYIISAQNQALLRHKKFIVAISGGSLPKLIASGLIENPLVKWETWKVFFVDERIVPLDHEDSNFANSMKVLFGKVPIDRSQLVSIMGLPPDDIDLDEMAPVVSSIYMAQVLEELDWSSDVDQFPRFDLILLGMGDDGHTCSLFPSHMLLNDEAIISWCNDSPKPPAHRITMTLPVLNAAHELAFVCAGSSKADILAAVLDQEPSATRPASLVKLAHKPVVWFVDEAAAAKTQYVRTATAGPAASSDILPVVDELPVQNRSIGSADLGGLQLQGMESYSIAPVESSGVSTLSDRGVDETQACSTEEEPTQQLSPEIRTREGQAIDVIESDFGYPHNLQAYPPVYPHLDELLYCPPPPIIEQPSIHKQSFLTQPPEKADEKDLTPFIASEEVIEAIDDSDDLVEDDLDQTIDSGEARDLGTAISSVAPISLTSKVDTGYPLNLNVYPSVYPHLEQMLYAPEVYNQPIKPPRIENHVVSPPIPLELDTVEKSTDSHAFVAPPPEQPRASDVKTHQSFGYPHNLIIYSAVYPHMQDMVYPSLIPRFAASLEVSQEVQSTRQAKRIPAPFPPFSVQVNGSRGIAYQVSPGDASSPLSPETAKVTRSPIVTPKSPVAAMPTTLSPAFYPVSQSPQMTTATRAFTPSLQYSQRDSQHDGSLTPAVSPLALRALPSTLQQEYYGEMPAPHAQTDPLSPETVKASRSPMAGPKSPVAAMPTTLSPAFYPGSQSSQVTTVTRAFTPSLQYSQRDHQRDGSLTPAVSPLAIRASLSTLEQEYYGEMSAPHAHIDQLSPETGKASRSTIAEPKSPVVALQTTLSSAFYPVSQSTQVTTVTRVFTPSLQYSQRDTQHNGSLTPAVSPLALHALPSTLQQEYYGEVPAPHAHIDLQPDESDVVPRSKLPTSPVAIIPSHLPESFYSTASEQSQQTHRTISPSLPFTQTIATKEGDSHAVPAGALDVPSSALGVAFFGGAAAVSEAQLTMEMNIEPVQITEDLAKPEEEIHQHIEADRQSEASSSQFSKEDSSIRSQTTLHQLTDDDWPVTPPSPDRLPSPDLMSRLASTPSLDSGNSIKAQFPAFKSRESPVGRQSSSSLMESDHDVRMSSMTEASMITPSVSQFHNQSVIEITHELNASPEDAPEFHTESTPRARAQPQLEASYPLSTSPDNFDEAQLHPGLPTQTPSDIHHVQDHVSPQHSASANGLRLELGDTEVKSDVESEELDALLPPSQAQQTPGSHDVYEKQRDVEEESVREELVQIQSSGSSECQMKSLRLLGEMDVDSMASEISPLRMASSPFMERLAPTPTFAKQFPSYKAALTTDDEQSFLSPQKIEADLHFPQVSLSDASVASPPRPPPLAINLPPAGPTEQARLAPSEAQAELCHSSTSEEVATPTGPILNERVISLTVQIDQMADAVDGTRSDSPFFLDQGPGSSGLELNHDFSSRSSPVHALTVDSAVQIERSLDTDQPTSSQFNSPMFPPLNLTMDLSDPLSAATTARSAIDTETTQSVTVGLEPQQASPLDQSSFDHQTNGLNLDRIRESGTQTPVTDSSEEVDLTLDATAVDPLPSITKRAPTPSNHDLEVSLESVTIDDSIPPPPSPILLPFQDMTEISEALAQFVYEAQEVALQRHGKFQLALGGSILPQILGEGLVGDDRIRWESWEIFLVEEAIAPLGSPQSVLSALTESIIQHVPIPRSQVHSIAELTQADIDETKTFPEGLDSLADSLADEYENRLIELFPEASHETGQPPEFDLILISIGEEGQVGSLYPSHPMLGESNWFVAWLGDAWEPPSHRITLTLPVLNSARQFAFLAIGSELAEIVSDGLDRSIQSDVPMEEDRVNPAALVKSSNLKPVVWFTDLAAASLTDYPKSAFWDEP
ncbi:hypothetical protein MJO29_009871 [Puccinia striiformis f. sp. tritici]|nr:hypothetical protein MJO29_009871 [Puccinia striiformis f. sp. tritici]